MTIQISCMAFLFGLVAQMVEHLVEAQSVDSPKLSETTIWVLSVTDQHKRPQPA